MTSGHPDNITLLPGGMQNWSDLDRDPAGSTSAAREMVRELVAGATRVAVVGPHTADLVTGLADLVPELTVIVRSIPDAITLGALLAPTDGARVLCCDVVTAGIDEQFDLVLALDDLSRLSSLETDRVTWEQAFTALVGLVADGGRLIFVAENELGLHRMTAIRSRYTSNADGDWAVTETFDRSRPRSSQALSAAFASAGLGIERHGEVLPTWQDQSVWTTGGKELGPAGAAILAACVLGAPTFRRVGTDPTRLTRAALLGGRLLDTASGWWVVATRANQAQPAARTQILASVPDGATRLFEFEGSSMTRDGEPFEVSDGQPFGEAMLDAAADGDLAELRTLVRRLVEHIDAHTTEGQVEADYADARPDNLIDQAHEEGLVPVSAGRSGLTRDAVLWAALLDIVHTIRARGARHPWPSATDDETMFASLVAMAGASLPDDVADLVVSDDSVPALPAADVAGLVALVERLTETNKALAARATWFEKRLTTAERDLQLRTERHRQQLAQAVRQQEVLRGSAEDLRRSLTYRMGNAVLGPVRTLRQRTRPQD